MKNCLDWVQAHRVFVANKAIYLVYYMWGVKEQEAYNYR